MMLHAFAIVIVFMASAFLNGIGINAAVGNLDPIYALTFIPGIVLGVFFGFLAFGDN